MPRSKNPRTPEQRAEISRANGAKSKGPKTAAGKDKVSRNALKHGLTSNRHIVLDDENGKAYDELRETYFERFVPMDGVESDLIQRMADAAWRMHRALCMETAALNCSRAEAEVIAPEHYVNPTNQDIAYLAYQDNRPTLESLHRYEQRILRIQRAAVADLILMRRAPELRPPWLDDEEESETNPSDTGGAADPVPAPATATPAVPQVPDSPNKPTVHAEPELDATHVAQQQNPAPAIATPAAPQVPASPNKPPVHAEPELDATHVAQQQDPAPATATATVPQVPDSPNKPAVHAKVGSTTE